MTSTMETRFLHAARGGGGAGGEELFASLTGFDCELSEAFKKEDRDRVSEVKDNIAMLTPSLVLACSPLPYIISLQHTHTCMHHPTTQPLLLFDLE